MEVEHLAVIQRKCAKCYQNWISRQQLCSMNCRGRERSSFQVTHGWNFSTPLHFFISHVGVDAHISQFCFGIKSSLYKIIQVFLSDHGCTREAASTLRCISDSVYKSH